MTSYLLDYCKNIFEKENLKSYRKINIINDFTIDNLKDIINIDEYNYDIIKKENIKGYYMNWHLDNAKVMNHKKNFIGKTYNQQPISDRHAIYYYLKKPDFSLIIYNSTYNKDFTGGTLEFIDGLKIYPDKGLYILFDSREIHKVNKIKSGIRNSYLIKFYKKI